MTEETEKRGPGRPPKKQTVACEVLRDFWPTEDGRIRAGTIVDLDPIDAIDKIEAGMVRKVR
jgi:hypothetical protein